MIAITRTSKCLCLSASVISAFSSIATEQPVFALPLNDTGIRYGGDFPKGVNEQCVAIITSENGSEQDNHSFIARQDCATGKSKKQSKGSTFTLQKIASNGQPLTHDAADWQCVSDLTTGLMWEVKNQKQNPNELHNKNDRFTWYNSNPTLNQGNIGDWNSQGQHCSGYQQNSPRTYCHIEQFVKRVNKQGLCGHNDWRVPEWQELAGLVNYGRFQPAIQTEYFPDTLPTFYWTTNPIAGRPIEAWSINFEFGYSSGLRKTDPRPVRLVRHNKQTQLHSTRFEERGSNSIIDNATGLQWQRCLLGQSGQHCESGTASQLNWAQALTVGIPKGWRIPNVRELASLVNIRASSPAAYSPFVASLDKYQVWTSSPYLFYPHYAWYLDFADGIFIYSDRQDKKAVLLVK